MIQQVRRFAQLFSGKIKFLLIASIVLGFLLSNVEIAFAQSIQYLLVALHLLPQSSVNIPDLFLKFSALSTLVLFGVLRSALQYLQIYLKGHTFEEAKFDLRKNISAWIFSSPSINTARASILFNESTQQAANSLKSIQGALVVGSTCVFLGFKLFLLAPQTTLFLLAIFAVLSLGLRPLNKKIKAWSQLQKKSWERTQNVLVKGIRNLLLLQIYHTHELEMNKAQNHLGTYLRNAALSQRFVGLRGAIPHLTAPLLVCGLVFLKSDLPRASLVSYLFILVRAIQYLSEFTQEYAAFLTSRPQVSQLVQWWHNDRAATLPAKKSNFSETGSVSPILQSQAPLGWRVTDLGFSYFSTSQTSNAPISSQTLLNNLNFEIKPGTLFLIHGPSGTGKSTLLNLLLGQTFPSNANKTGSIEVFQTENPIHPINYSLERHKNEILAHIGYVGVDNFLIEGTLRENLLYGVQTQSSVASVPSVAETPRPISDTQIFEALLLAGCDFIYSFPLQLDHTITEQGHGLSAGQKQRLSLARAILRNPLALVLDEATANLDSETERKIIETLVGLKHRFTLIAVSHRPSFQQYADQILHL